MADTSAELADREPTLATDGGVSFPYGAMGFADTIGGKVGLKLTGQDCTPMAAELRAIELLMTAVAKVAPSQTG